MHTALLIAAALAGAASRHPAAETRCGWFWNPTPANYSLRDGAGEWILSEQGGYSASGMDELPDYGRGGWVVTNGPDYGYGCDCVSGVFDHRRLRAVSVTGVRSRSLARCRADRRLPKPR